MIIRKAIKEDRVRVEKLGNTFGNILHRFSPLDKLDPNAKPKKGEKNYYEKFILGRNKWCSIAEENNKLLGLILLNIENRERWWKIKKVGYIDLVVVDKKTKEKA